MKECKNGHPTECNKIGEINRFNEEKEYCCKCYYYSEHKKEHNPDFEQYCVSCQKSITHTAEYASNR